MNLKVSDEIISYSLSFCLEKEFGLDSDCIASVFCFLTFDPSVSLGLRRAIIFKFLILHQVMMA